jgi:hypothetical protein
MITNTLSQTVESGPSCERGVASDSRSLQPSARSGRRKARVPGLVQRSARTSPPVAVQASAPPPLCRRARHCETKATGSRLRRDVRWFRSMCQPARPAKPSGFDKKVVLQVVRGLIRRQSWHRPPRGRPLRHPLNAILMMISRSHRVGPSVRPWSN